MATTLTGLRVQDTYNAIIKIGDNSTLTGTGKLLSDGFGNSSNLYLSTTSLGIGVAPTENLHIAGSMRLTGSFKDKNNQSGTTGQVLTSTATGTDWKTISDIDGVTSATGGTANYVPIFTSARNIENSIIQATATLVTISGNLDVNGTVTYIDTIDLSVKDPLIKLANANVSNTLDIGFYGKYIVSATTKYLGLYSDASDSNKFRLFTGLETEPTTVVDSSDTTFAVGTLIANLEGNVTGNLSGNVTGGTISGTTGVFSSYVSATDFRPTNIVTNKIVKFSGTSLDDSIMSDDGSTVTVNGSLTASNVLYGSNSSGTQEGTVNDWDAPTKTGFYSSDNASNRWAGQANWSSILHFKLYDNNNNYASQIGFNTYNDGLWTRTNNSGTWTSWYKIWTDNVHPTTLAGYGITDAVTIDTAQTITGVKTFTGLVTGIAPTADLNFATKKYVDDNLIPAQSLSEVLAVGNTSGANNIIIADDQRVGFGTDSDLKITHSGTAGTISNDTGTFTITNTAIDADINFYATVTDGAGGGTEELYFQLDGSIQKNEFYKPAYFKDNIKAEFGTDADFSIYHNGTDSYIDNNTGDLKFLSTITTIRNGADSETLAKFTEDSGVELYFNNVKKFETTTNGVYVTGSGIFSGALTTVGQLMVSTTTPIFAIQNGVGTTKMSVDYLDVQFDSGFAFKTNSTLALTISNTQTATFESSVTATSFIGPLTGLASLNTPLNDIRSLGVQYFTNGTNPNITTAEVMAEIESDGGFDSYSSVFKTAWSYSGNYNLTDAGDFTETAGSSWITWTDNASDTTRGNITALAIAPNTGGSAGGVFIYNDQGTGYNAGWRQVWTSTTDGTGSGLDADLLDGQEGSYYAPATGGSYVAKAGDTMTGNLKLNDDVLLEIGNGTGGDAWIYHNGTDTLFRNATGDLYIDQLADDKNISFRSDDGSGGTVEYFRVDGGDSRVIFGRSIQMADNVSIYFGNAVADDGYIKWDSTANQLFINGNAKFLEDLYVTGNQYFNGTVVEGDGKTMLRYNDAWLRINEDNDFTSGIYCGTGILRTDGQFQVGSGGNQFKVESNGNTTINGSLTADSFISALIKARKSQTDNNYTTAALWTESYSTTTTGIAFHISGVVGKFLEMRTDGILYWENQRVFTSGMSSNASITGKFVINEGQVWDETTQGTGTGSLHLDPDEATNHAGGAITFGASDAGGGANAHAGIYIRSDGTYGTKMYFSTTDSYGAGSKTAMNILQNGQVNITRSNLIVNTDVRAPIFYDSDNTAYYTNPGTDISAILAGSIGINNTSPINTAWGSATTTKQLSITGANYGVINLGSVTALTKYSMGVGGNTFYMAYDNIASRHNITINSSGHIVIAVDIRSPLFYDSDNTTYYGNFADITIGKYFGRAASNEGFQVGSYNNIGSNGTHSNPIYTIGSSYIPALTTLGNMYGIGYTNTSSSFIGLTGASGWGMYVAADGDARIFLGGGNGNVSTTGVMYAHQYYDYGNTAYYLDPASTSNINALSTAGNIESAGRIRLAGGTDSGSQLNLWADASGYCHIAGYNLRFMTGGNNARVQRYTMDHTGIFTANASVRSPVFYDSNDTTYYLNPADASFVNTLRSQALGANNSGSQSNQNGLSLYGSYSGGLPTYGMLFSGVSVNGSFGGVTGDWATYFTMNGSTGRGWVFKNVSGSPVASITNLGWAQFAASVRAPIFYDSNNTGYYIHPDSTSVMNQINAGSGNNPALVCAANSSYGAGTELYIGGWSAGTTVSRVRNSNGNLHIDSKQGHELYLNSYPTGNVRVGNGGGYLLAYNSMRSPIFYDSNDTVYYLNPASDSNLVNIGLKGRISFPASGLATYARGSQSYAIYQESGAWTSPYPDLNIGFHTGISIGAYGGYNGTRFFDNSDMATQIMSVGNFSDGLGGGQVYVNDALQAGSSLRAPIFYDSNNTTYLADLSNTSTSINAAGTGIFGGDVVAYSDKKLKTNIKTLDGSKVLKMRGVSFDRIDTGNASSGVIAQEIQEIAPELVNDKNGTLAVAYGNLTGYLIEAIKNQQIVIEDLKKRLETLENN